MDLIMQMPVFKEFINDNGNVAKSHQIIIHDNKTYFQSYGRLVAYLDHKTRKVFALKDAHLISYATAKHLYMWLRDYTTLTWVNGKKDYEKLISDKLVTELDYIKSTF